MGIYYPTTVEGYSGLMELYQREQSENLRIFHAVPSINMMAFVMRIPRVDLFENERCLVATSIWRR